MVAKCTTSLSYILEIPPTTTTTMYNGSNKVVATGNPGIYSYTQLLIIHHTNLTRGSNYMHIIETYIIYRAIIMYIVMLAISNF